MTEKSNKLLNQLISDLYSETNKCPNKVLENDKASLIYNLFRGDYQFSITQFNEIFNSFISDEVIVFKESEKAHKGINKRALIFARDGKCLNCGTIQSLTIDHILPKSKGGSNEFENLQTLCKRCNLIKGAKEIDYRGKKPNNPNNAKV
jgi:hypothetical protein